MVSETLQSLPEASVSASAALAEANVRRGIWTLEKFQCGEDGIAEAEPFETLEWENAYINAGAQVWLDLLIGAGSPTAFNAANAYIGVGDSNTAVSASQTDLQAASNKVRVGMDATYPSRSSQVVTWRATFGSAVANFAWAECGLFNHASAGSMLSRIVQSMGTKASGTSWVLSYTITVP